MASKKQYSYFVGVMCDDGVRFVTEVNNIDKTALWESGKEALEMPMSVADSLVFGLLMNFHYAFTVKVPYGVKFGNHPKAEEKGV